MKRDYFVSGKPVHRKSYCAFLDVLGFTARIRKSVEDGRADDLLQEFHGVLSKEVTSLKKDAADSCVYFRSLTDNIILAHPGYTAHLEDEFGLILFSLLRYQFNMAQHGFFIRGGLSVGDLFVDENTVYGPALLEAYELESRHAVNPMIVLSDEARKLTRAHLAFYAEGHAPQNRCVLVNTDGSYFINYLDECLFDQMYSQEVNWPSLAKHKSNIETARTEHIQSSAVCDKYDWLAAYHNYFCDSVMEYQGYTPTLRIADVGSSHRFRTLEEDARM